MQYDHTLTILQNTLDDLRGGTINTGTLCLTWRNQAALLGELPPRYGQVMEDLLGRLEAGSLFTEESCSFSQDDLLANLDSWLAKARQTLTTE